MISAAIIVELFQHFDLQMSSKQKNSSSKDFEKAKKKAMAIQAEIDLALGKPKKCKQTPDCSCDKCWLVNNRKKSLEIDQKIKSEEE